MRKKSFLLGVLLFAAVNSLYAQDHPETSAGSDTAFIKTGLEEIDMPCLAVRPLISADGNTLYFSCRETGGGWFSKKGQDIYVAHKDPGSGTWGAAERLPQPLNNRRPNAVASVNPNGKELVLINAYPKTANVPLVRSIKERGRWMAPSEINIQGYENFSPYADFFVDYQQEVLLMAIETFESEREQDLYVSFPGGNKSWKEPLHMGDVINSERSDFAPFMGSDGRTLFFSSFGHDTLGGSDIYMSVRLDDSWTNWSEPVKLGPAVNTADDENYVSIDRKMEYLYLTSQKEGAQEGSIVRVSLPEDLTAINGPVLSQLNSKEIQKIMDSGHYTINPDGRKTNAEGVAIAGWPTEPEREVAMEEPAKEEEGDRSIPARLRGFKPAEEAGGLSAEAAGIRDYLEEALPGTGLAIRVQGDTTEFMLVQNILYGFNRIYPDAEYQPRLNRIVRVLRDQERLKVRLTGHTDNLGSAEVNEAVAHLRVRNVSLYLSGRGVDRNRIEVTGAGQAEPVAPNESDEGRNMNRRVETIIRYIEK